MSQTCHFTCFLTFLPFKCHKLLMAHEDLGCELRVSRSRRAPLFSPFGSQRAGKLSVGPLGRPSPNMRCTSLNTTAPLCSTDTQPRQAKAQPPDTDACCREGSRSLFQLGRAPRISPSWLQATRTDRNTQNWTAGSTLPGNANRTFHWKVHFTPKSKGDPSALSTRNTNKQKGHDFTNLFENCDSWLLVGNGSFFLSTMAKRGKPYFRPTKLSVNSCWKKRIACQCR